MKRLAVISLVALASCAWQDPVLMQQVGVSTGPDAAAQVVMQCDQLRLTSFEAHRLCVLRGIDRLAVRPQSPTISHVPLLAHPYPPLAPSNAVPVYPAPRY